MNTMQSFLMLFYLLDQCFDDCPEESLGGLLGAISPELWRDGQPADKAVLLDWEKFSRRETVNAQNIVRIICDFLECYENQFGFNFAQTKRWLLSQASEKNIRTAAEKTADIYKRFEYVN